MAVLGRAELGSSWAEIQRRVKTNTEVLLVSVWEGRGDCES